MSRISDSINATAGSPIESKMEIIGKKLICETEAKAICNVINSPKTVNKVALEEIFEPKSRNEKKRKVVDKKIKGSVGRIDKKSSKKSSSELEKEVNNELENKIFSELSINPV